MREIKFRAKPIDSKEWIYGGGVHKFIEPNSKIEVYLMFGQDQDGRPYITKVQGDTVGQFTGMINKQKQEIYEKDIVKFSTSYYRSLVSAVFYNDSQATYEVRYNIREKSYGVDSISESAKVIGNLIDSPALMKDQKRKAP